MRYSHALLLSFPLGYLIRIMWNHPIYAKLIISQCCVREVALLKILTYDSYSAAVFPWDRHVAKAKLSETRPCRAAPHRVASRRRYSSYSWNPCQSRAIWTMRGIWARGDKNSCNVPRVTSSHASSFCHIAAPRAPRIILTVAVRSHRRMCHLIARYDTRSIKIKTSPFSPAMSRCRLTDSHDRGGLSSSMRPMGGDVSKRYRFHQKFRSDDFAARYFFVPLRGTW